MSSRLGQTISRYNASVGHNLTFDSGVQHCQGQAHGDNTPSVPGGTSNNGMASAAHVIAHQLPPSHYKCHRGHRRGHSYGGVINPPSSGVHHSQLEARPSHPNTHHGVLLSHGSSALQKGHRRALSGCLPMVGMGAVAWSSLRDLDTAANPPGSHFTSVAPLRSLSPEVSRPSSPDEAKGSLKLSPQTLSTDLKKDVKILKHEGSAHSMECGLGPCPLPRCFQTLATVEFFVCILAVLVTLQQGVASGYVNSVITTIETRFEIPSRFSGLIASSYEMGNVLTVLFVSYLGAKRHIPRWIATGVMVMVVGCIIFTLPHFLSTDNNGGGGFEFMSHHHEPSLVKASAAEPSFSQPNHWDNDNKLPPSYNPSNGSDLPSDTGGNHSTLYTYNTYANSSDSAETIVSLRQVSYVDASRPINGTRQGRNSICHSVNPQSSPFIQGAIQRISSDRDGRAEKDAEFPEVRQELMSVGCSVEIIEEDGRKTTQASQESYGHPLILFMLAQWLLGSGGSPLFTLGITYVDDHVPSESSSVYIGVIYAMAAFGPVVGFLVGAWMLSIPSSTSHLVNPDAQFIGLWWGGFLIAGGLLFVAALPFLAFPRIVASKGGKEEVDERSDDACEESSSKKVVETDVVVVGPPKELQDDQPPVEPSTGAYGQSIKDIPRSIWRLITNPAYVLTCLGGCMELNIVSGFVVFLPKYLETQFSLGKSEASLFTGGIAIPGACLGIFFGGYLVKKMQMKPSGACKFVVTTNVICIIGYVLFFFLGCSNPNLAGATIPYPGAPESANPALFDVNLTSSCNSGCSCDASLDAQYVCHEGVTFFSPCHAGCSVNYTQCTCAGGSSVTPGACADKPCNTLLPFMIVLFFMTATVAVTQMPLLMIVLRSVSPEERSFALGMQFVIFRLLGYIPSPIVFGNVIDSACLLWSIKRCSTLLPAVSGRCLLYDIQDFRYKYVGMLSGLKLLALAIFIYDLYQLKRIEKEEAEEIALENDNAKMNSNSIISLDKLFLESDSGSVTTITTTATVNPVGIPPSNPFNPNYRDEYYESHMHVD